MTKFEKIKKELIDKAKTAGASCSEYRRACNAKTEPELLKVIYNNLNWCVDHKVISDEYFAKFTKKNFEASGIMNTGEDNTGFANAGNSNAGNSNAGYSNAGYSNAGNYNAGNRNAGNRNAGNDNAGNSNAGYYNAGYYNAGYSNAGNSNAGNDNAGNSNAGNSNAGYYNAGYYNAGNYNAGNRNAGYSNAGNDNAGAFNTESGFTLFNKKAKMTFEQFRESKACNLLHNIDTTLWIPTNNMSVQEKKDHPYHVTTLGYVRNIPFKEAFANNWNNWSAESRKAFTSLENFDAKVFEEITSVKV